LLPPFPQRALRARESILSSWLRKASKYVRDGLGWRIVKLIGKERADRITIGAAKRWRRGLERTRFVGIAGSAGKTTTKDLAIAVLSRSAPASGSLGTFNVIVDVAKAILRVRRRQGYCVVELPEHEPGALPQALEVLKPDIGVVTVIGDDHWSAYQSREAIAAEVSKLVAALPASGTAVLNADDPLVLPMGQRCRAKVITHGVSPQARLRAEDVHAAWPERLSFTLVYDGQRETVRTQLCGEHWLGAVLAAIGVGLAGGLSLAECVRGVAGVTPFEGRMQPVATPDGVTFIRDDWKAPLWTVDASFAFMRSARARRKIIVIGTLSDRGRGAGLEHKCVALAKQAQKIADSTIFVGPSASSVLRARRSGSGEDTLRAFTHVRHGAEYLNSIARDGDLVLLKGTNRQDHLVRMILARSGKIACWRDDCDLFRFCDNCRESVCSLRPAELAAGRACYCDARRGTEISWHRSRRANHRRPRQPGGEILGHTAQRRLRSGRPHSVVAWTGMESTARCVDRPRDRAGTAHMSRQDARCDELDRPGIEALRRQRAVGPRTMHSGARRSGHTAGNDQDPL
jgi:UDP-N-acetylmuramoyl-tripeptide--D-alanyl-D-alanine ligase